MTTILPIRQGGTGVQTASEITGILDTVVGDTGEGGTKGLVPAPGVGDADKVLSGSGDYILIGSANMTATVPTFKYGDFTATDTKWSGTGPYLLTIPYSVHGISETKYIIGQLFKTGTENELVGVTTQVTDTGDVVFKINLTAGKFPGYWMLVG